MVKTRTQQYVAEVEVKRAKTIPESALPPKVCHTPPNSVRKPSSMSTAQTHKSAKKRLMFSADPPQEFMFDLKSPPARRIHASNHQLVHDSVIRLEFEARNGVTDGPIAIGDKEREKYREWVSRDLRSELKRLHGIDCDGVSDNVVSLKERLDLAESLRRRSEIRRTPLFGMIPNEMSLRDLQRELHKRRIAFRDLDHFQASTALERALLKEDAEGLIGEGYQFGRRLVSASDVIAFYQPSDKEMRDMLQSRSVSGPMIPRKKSEKLELLSKHVELEQEELVRQLMKAEIEKELCKRNIPYATDQYSEMFEILYQSGMWKLPFADISTAPYEPSDEQQSGCTIS